jgi:thiol:disulfide interchange protein DsbC
MASVNGRDMVVFGPEDAKYTVDVFTDIDCPYCVRLHNQMAEYNRLGIRIRYLAFPRAGISSSSYDKWVSVWCSDDRQTAMGDAKNGKRIPAKKCDSPVKQQFALGRAVGVRGTPSLILENGHMIPGYVLYILLALIIVCTWFGVELRKTHRDIAHLLLGVAGLLTILAVVAFFGIH